MSEKTTNRKIKIAELIRQLFMENGELFAAEVYRQLKQQGRKTSYKAIQRTFYDLRQLGMIEFVRSENSSTPINRQYYRIASGREDDSRWFEYPHHLLYPSSRLGGLTYVPGLNGGRDSRYTKTV
jgi:hypothetical protein